MPGSNFIEKLQAVYWDSFKSKYDTMREHPWLKSHIHLLAGINYGSSNGRISTNCLGQLPGDRTFKTTEMGLYINASSPELRARVLSSCVARFVVESKPVLDLHPELFPAIDDTIKWEELDHRGRLPGATETDIKLPPGMLSIDISLLVPPRQNFCLEITLTPDLVNDLKRFKDQPADTAEWVDFLGIMSGIATREIQDYRG
jgi:hypothetical protein